MNGQIITRRQEMSHNQIAFLGLFHGLFLFISSMQPAYSLTVAVFGGSGYIGRRVCRTLVESSDMCDSVISISRSGKPSSYYCDGVWSDSVEWLSFDLDKTWQAADQNLKLPPIDAAISCIGNIQPIQEWGGFFGLSFDDDKLLFENGVINQRAIELAKQAGAKRFAFVSVNYETAKCLESPIEGYLDGKRMADSSACDAFGEEQTVLVGPSFVYGGKRFPKLGKIYRFLVESPPARAYLAGNNFLRNLSSAPIVDWVEKMVFSSPVEVDKVARVLCAGALGLIDRDMVGSRRQDFYGLDGKPVFFPNALCVDGTSEIERVDGLVASNLSNAMMAIDTKRSSTTTITSSAKKSQEPLFEGGLIGKQPFLYPFPIIFLFAAIFWSVTTQQFIQVS